MGEKVGPGFTTGTSPPVDRTIHFEKGNPLTGYWYIDDRAFVKVRTTQLIAQAGGHVWNKLWDKDPMDEN